MKFRVVQFLGLISVLGSVASAAPLPTSTPPCYGGVLVAGGIGGGYRVMDVEVYDPILNWWYAVQLLPRPLSDLAAAPVQVNGVWGVMALGGQSNFGYQATADFFDPGANTWSPLANMSTQRYSPGAAPVAVMVAGTPVAGILVIGGEDAGSPPYLASTEFYNPQNNTWTARASMSTVRFALAAVPVTIGSVEGVLAFGGATVVAGGQLSSAEFYDPIADTWTLVAPMQTARSFLAGAPLTLLVNGTPVAGVLAAGGLAAGAWPPLANVEWYNPQTDMWMSLAPMPTARYALGAAALTVGGVTSAMVVGGGSTVCCPSGAWVYDRTGNSWTPEASLGIGRTDLAASAMIVSCTPTVTETLTPTETPTGTPACGVPGLCISHNALNPTEGPAYVSFATAQDGDVDVSVFNSAGERIAQLWSGLAVRRRLYQTLWFGRNQSGRAVTSGVYVVRMTGTRERYLKRLAVVQ